MLYVAVTTVIVSLAWWIWRSRAIVSAEGKAVFITGCDTGIGHQVALLLDGLGFSVLAGCLCPDGDGARTLRNQSSDKLVVIPLDVTSSDHVVKAVEVTQRICTERGVDLYCVINNAGLCIVGELEWHTWDQIDKLINVNIIGYLRIIKAFLPILKVTGGRIINITSVNGRWAYPGLSVYSATKFAIEGLSNSLRVELDKYGVKVVVVAPGDYARLTHIMKAHRANAQDQWDALPVEGQEKCGEYFWAFHETCLKYSGLGSPSSFKSSPLLTDIHSAVVKKYPKLRYVSASLGVRLFFILVNVVPLSVADWILHVSWKAIFTKKPPSFKVE